MSRAEWVAWAGLPLATASSVELASGIRRTRMSNRSRESRVPRLQMATKLLRDFLRRGGAFVQQSDGSPLPFCEQRMAFDTSNNYLYEHNVRCLGFHLRRLANAKEIGESDCLEQLTVEVLADPEVGLLGPYCDAVAAAEAEHEDTCTSLSSSAPPTAPELMREHAKLIRAFRPWVLDRIAHM